MARSGVPSDRSVEAATHSTWRISPSGSRIRKFRRRFGSRRARVSVTLASSLARSSGSTEGRQLSAAWMAKAVALWCAAPPSCRVGVGIAKHVPVIVY